MKKDYGVVIIGAGVIGLAVANSLANSNIKSVLIIEKDESYGRGISSRNSEVIHSGVYYPKGTLKQRLCFKGRKLLYEFCDRHNIWYNRCGKLIVAQRNDIEAIEKIYSQAKENNIESVYQIDSRVIQKKNEYISAYCGLQIDCTGIVSAHELMNTFYNISNSCDHDYLFKSEIYDASPINGGYELLIKNAYGNTEKVSCDIVINSTGLNSDCMAKLIYDEENIIPEIIFSKGCYFKLSSKWKNKFNQLVYPVPDYANQSLGIHLTIDRNGAARLGPSAHLMNERIEDYSVNPELKMEFYKEAKKYIPLLKNEDLTPDYSGIRPKINKKEDVFKDFYIKNEKTNGFPGWINLIGIESPGLTSSMAIGQEVLDLIS